ncbi:GNAT family N-acetyltransferase [Rickettsiella endosymbiont of Miltochrista miniata]|uniref:GNAT family N-acetyltransferase n=1 Tax=Rickettsiella endosymbiont of Miltochrista miniata TaxID=3066239 RepID=UPI00313DF136
MIILKTKRLILRTWNEQDLDPMSAINQDPLVCEFLPQVGNRAATKTLIQLFINHYEKYGFTAYAVELKSNSKFIGFVGLLIPSFEAHFTPAVEIAWRLDSQLWGKGYATEAAKAVVDFAFTTLKLEEVVSFTVENNIRSRRVMEKIGMHHTQHDDFDHPKLLTNSSLCRHVLYRLSRIE